MARYCRLCGCELEPYSQAKFCDKCRPEGKKIALQGKVKQCARPGCPISFIPKNNCQKYCGDDCRDAMKWPVRKQRIEDHKRAAKLKAQMAVIEELDNGDVASILRRRDLDEAIEAVDVFTELLKKGTERQGGFSSGLQFNTRECGGTTNTGNHMPDGDNG